MYEYEYEYVYSESVQRNAGVRIYIAYVCKEQMYEQGDVIVYVYSQCICIINDSSYPRPGTGFKPPGAVR